MKRILFILLIAALLCGCIVSETSQTTEQTTALPTAEPTAESAIIPVEPEPTAIAEEPSVPLFDGTVPKSAQTLVLSIPIESFEPVENALALLPDVQTVEVTFSSPWADDLSGYAAYAAFKAAHPDLQFTEQYGDFAAPAETTELTLTEPVSDVAALIGSLPALETVTLWDGASSKDAASALSAREGLRVLWNDAIFGASDSSAVSISGFSGASFDAVLAYLKCFPALSEADLLDENGNNLFTLAEGDALMETFPNLALRRTVPLCGADYDSFSESLTLEKAQIDDTEAFAAELARFPRLSFLDLTDCSLEDAEIAALRERFPEKGIVWTIRVRGRRIRTDVVAYTSNQRSDNTSRITSKDAEPLQYCTNLIALDLGHNAITTLEWMRPLKNLQLIILADNKITDISVLGELPRLKYVEIFYNTRLADISPLGNLPDLLDVNICFTDVVDLSPLLNCKKLERIWLVGADYTKEGLLQLQQTYPDATIWTEKGSGSTGAGWRSHPRYYAYLEMFKTNAPVEPFLP